MNLRRRPTSRPSPPSLSPPPPSLPISPIAAAVTSAAAPLLPTHLLTSPALSFLTHLSSTLRSLSDPLSHRRSLATLDSLISRTTYLFDSVSGVLAVHVLARSNKLNRAKSLLSLLRSRGKLSDLFLYSLVVQCLVCGGTVRDADMVWGDVGGVDSLGTTNYSEFVTHLCKFGDVGEIEWVYRKAVSGGGVLTERNYMVLVGALCKKGASSAMEVVRDMEEKRLEPDYFTYLVLFQCLCRNGRFYEADIVLRTMYRRRWRFDVCVYASFLHGLCKSGKFREANKLFRKLIDRDHKSSGDLHLKMGRRAIFQLDCRGLIPATLVYETYFRSLCSVGRLADAEKLLKEMMGRKYVPEVCVHRYFIRALFRAGRVDDAVKYSHVLRKKDIVSEDDIVVSLIDGFCEIGKTDAARELLDDHIGRIAPISHLCNRVLGSYWKGGRIGEAIHLFERMKSGHYGLLDFSAYNTMFNGFVDCGEVEKAVLIFQEMVEENVPVNGTLYKTLVRVLSKNGKIDEAYKYLNEMMESDKLMSYFEWKEAFFSDFCTVEMRSFWDYFETGPS